MTVAVFFAEPTGKVVYTRSFECAADHRTDRRSRSGAWPKRTPSISCPTCGERARMRGLRTEMQMRRQDTGELFASPRELPPGAVWEYRWALREKPTNWTKCPDEKGVRYCVHRPGADGRVLVCKLPDGHDWLIDARCNNCGSPEDDEHWCWVRHGRPEDGTLHVDKEGLTCSAGAGSIDTGSWHGFLHHGQLKSC